MRIASDITARRDDYDDWIRRWVLDVETHRGSTTYGGAHHLRKMFTADLPKTSTGKIQKFVLRERAMVTP